MQYKYWRHFNIAKITMAKCNFGTTEKEVCSTDNDPPPAYEDIFPQSCGDLSPPYPLPYEKHEVFDRILLPDTKDVFSYSEVREEVRCSTCFDPVCEDKEKKLSGDMIKDGIRSYHYECYIKTKGPKCNHCCFALIPWPKKNLSGRWVTYDGKRFHEECYELEAGPRCSLCFNVIVEKPKQGFSGLWRWSNGKRYHDECFMKKLYIERRVHNS